MGINPTKKSFHLCKSNEEFQEIISDPNLVALFMPCVICQIKLEEGQHAKMCISCETNSETIGRLSDTVSAQKVHVQALMSYVEATEIKVPKC